MIYEIASHNIERTGGRMKKLIMIAPLCGTSAAMAQPAPTSDQRLRWDDAPELPEVFAAGTANELPPHCRLVVTRQSFARHA